MMMLASSFWQTAGDVFFAPSLQLVLLIGSATLAIALLILTLTRLGHARPIMKCVILSVIAHILLLGYAYGTKLIFEYPVAASDPLHVQLIGYDISDEESPLPVEPTAVQEIDRFANPTQLPEVESLQRPGLESPIVFKRMFDAEVQPVTDPIGDFESDSAPAALESVRPSMQLDPSVPREFDAPQIQVEKIEFKRRGDDPTEIPAPRFESTSPPETERPDIPSAEFARETTAESLPRDNQRVEELQSQLVVPAENDGLVDQILAKTTPADTAASSQGIDDGPSVSDAMNPKSAPRRLGDGQMIPELYKLRVMPNRSTILKRRGGSEETEAAVNAALAWLTRNQKDDGRWDPRETGAGNELHVNGHDRGGCGINADTGITGLAVLAFLGSGQTHLEGNQRVVVQKALEFLIRNQAADGNLAGNARLYARMYCHSMALLALSEALAVTGDRRLLDAVEKGVHYSVRAQNQTDGGWRYQPKDQGDMSQFGWQVMSLHSAAIGGINISPQAIDGMHVFLDLCTSGQNNGLAAYRPGQGASTTMTAEALLSRFFLKEDVSPGTLAEAQQRILQNKPTPAKINVYYWYYATMAMYHAGGEGWDQWNEALQRTLLPLQVESGNDRGSWDPDGLWAGYGGRVYSTAMGALCLEVYYRYLPIYEVNDSK